MKKRVVVGLSGGVDSSVSAYLLKEQGYEVIGLFMKNWHDDSVTISDECPWLEDSNDALMVAQQLGIPFQTIDLSADYRKQVVDYMFGEYEKGRTPNPDVLCNREIKFAVFMEMALSLGADYVATGHYCRKDSFVDDSGKTIYRLLAGKDDNKDQSYFLCQLNQNQLSKALFPIGELQKSEVREIANKQDLVNANKKDSQGICFVGKVKLPEFLQQKLKPKKGTVYEVSDKLDIFKAFQSSIDSDSIKDQEQLLQLSVKYKYAIEDSEVIGEHRGAHFYTIGQRKGLNIGGKAKPLFVLGTDIDSNAIFVGQGAEHPGLKRNGLFISKEEEHWLRVDKKLKVGEKLNCLARIRYREPLSQVTLYKSETGLFLIFDEAKTGVASGQFAAWYDGDELLGSGVIH